MFCLVFPVFHITLPQFDPLRITVLKVMQDMQESLEYHAPSRVLLHRGDHNETFQNQRRC